MQIDSEPLPLTINPSSPEGQERLQQEGVELISRIPYGGIDEPEIDNTSENSTQLDEFLDGISELFS